MTATPGTSDTSGTRTNVALATNGGIALASSYFSNPNYGTYLPSYVIDGSRRATNGAIWLDNTSGSFPDWIEVDFNGSKTISEIDVVTQQDDTQNPVEPTLTQTFSLYGITNFDVQYWDGSSWVTVPNGGVTGNNKVWRQFTFSSITTSKIRVLVNDGVDHIYSRVVEVEAWGTAEGGSSESTTADIQWLVTDQLGTPRIVFDKTGSLASMKRHDYLPFGEELFTAANQRTTTQGYSVPDGLRQKFTLKERDIETGLDYFGARYHGSSQGRFITPDPLLSSGRPDDPQSWNRYSYTLNNPLCFVDPTGLFSFGAEVRDKEREKIINAYNKLNEALGKLKVGSKAYKSLERSLVRLGKPGVANGVVVTVGSVSRAAASADTDVSRINKGTVTITFNEKTFAGSSDEAAAGALGHEGCSR